jgi:hypothetical protein
MFIQSKLGEVFGEVALRTTLLLLAASLVL